MAYAVGSAYVGRRQVRTAFQTGNRSDTEDSFRFLSPEIVTEAGRIPGQFQTINRGRGAKMRTFPSEEALVAAYWRDWRDLSIGRPAENHEKSSFLKSQAGSGFARDRFENGKTLRNALCALCVAHPCGTVDQPTSNQ